MSVTLHTDLGDIKIEVDCKNVKKAAYNFLALCASGYYDNTLIHRNIKGFMVQMGDPTGTGKGGTSLLLSRSAYSRKEYMGQQV
jgi:peptidyl-prolyl cis-trans isomerase-like 3